MHTFRSDLQFSPEQEELLQEEIAELDDAIACHVHVIDAVTQEIVGTASVQLWVMVEDSVNILRQVSTADVAAAKMKWWCLFPMFCDCLSMF